MPSGTEEFILNLRHVWRWLTSTGAFPNWMPIYLVVILCLNAYLTHLSDKTNKLIYAWFVAYSNAFWDLANSGDCEKSLNKFFKNSHPRETKKPRIVEPCDEI